MLIYQRVVHDCPWSKGQKSKQMLALTVRTDLNQALIVSPNTSQSLDQFINAGNCRFSPAILDNSGSLPGFAKLVLFTILKGIGNSIINSIQFIKSIILLLIVPICWLSPHFFTFPLTAIPHACAMNSPSFFIDFPCFLISPNALQNSVQTTFINFRTQILRTYSPLYDLYNLYKIEY